MKGLAVTAANVRYAARKRATVLHQIETGTFNYARTFPGSRQAARFPAPAPATVAEALERWLAVRTARCAPSTLRGYEKDIRRHLLPRWGEYPLSAVRPTELESWLTVELKAYHPKTVNNLSAPLRKVLADAVADGVIERNPFDRLGYIDVPSPTPDPFTGAELYRLLSAPTHRPAELNYIEFACFSGLSTSEAIALAREDVDWSRRLVTVNRACVLGKYKRPKTLKRHRTIKLFRQAYDALLRQKAARRCCRPARWKCPSGTTGR